MASVPVVSPTFPPPDMSLSPPSSEAQPDLTLPVNPYSQSEPLGVLCWHRFEVAVRQADLFGPLAFDKVTESYDVTAPATDRSFEDRKLAYIATLESAHSGVSDVRDALPVEAVPFAEAFLEAIAEARADVANVGSLADLEAFLPTSDTLLAGSSEPEVVRQFEEFATTRAACPI